MSTPVALSRDAGGFYCAHVFFVAQRFARERALVGGDPPRVGFLHVPRDPQCFEGAAPVDPRARHSELLEVLTRAARGLVDAIPHRPARILITGFGPFEDVVDNPTGDFVSRPALTGEVRAAVQVDEPKAELTFAALPVDDRAIQPESDASIQRLIERERPDALLMMGVGRAGFCVETIADDGGLELDPPRHAAGSPRTSLEENLTLARALKLA